MKKLSTLLVTLCLLLCAKLAFSQLTAWQYRQPLILKNEDNKARTNYTYKLIFDTETLVGKGLLATNGSDLRFASDCAGASLIDFWVEKKYNDPKTVIWLFIPQLNANESKTIFLFGKNPAATNASDFDKAFPSQLIISVDTIISDSIWTYNYIRIDSGATATMFPTLPMMAQTPMTMNASKIDIFGTFRADSAGFAGGLGGPGEGPGGGGSTFPYGTGGGGAGHGGVGGMASINTGLGAPGGPVYDTASTLTIQAGSGGGAPSAVGTLRPGGPGGGRISIFTEDITINGSVTANGGNGLGVGTITYGSGAGSGGGILIYAQDIFLKGKLTANGGIGGDGGVAVPYYPGGGGGGGVIKTFVQNSFINTGQIKVDGGLKGEPTCCIPAEDGMPGVIHNLTIPNPGASLNIKPTPHISLDAAPVICDGSQVSVVSHSTGPKFAYYVNGAQVYSGTEDTVKVTAHNGDTIYVDAYTSATCFERTDTIYVTTSPLPMGSFNADSISICGTSPALITISSTTATSWQWLSGTTPITNETNSNTTVTAPGKYSVILTDGVGCQDTLGSVHVASFPQPTGAASETAVAYCPNETTTVFVMATNANAYQWYKGSTVLGTDSVQTLAGAGNYYCIVSGQGNCTASSDTIVVTEKAIPAPTIDTANGTAICGNSPFSISCPATFLTYEWYKNDNAPSGPGSDTYSVTDAGSYKVRVLNADGCYSISDAVNISRLSEPTRLNADSVQFCEGKATQIGATTTEALTYSWKLNGNPEPTFTSNRIVPAQSGDYEISYTNGLSCTFTYATNVTINPKPTGTLSTGDTSICPNSGFTIQVSTTASKATWKRGSSIVANDTTEYAPTVSGNYSAQLTENGCIGFTDTITITLLAKPSKPTITSKLDTLTSTIAPGYQWLLDGFPISGATNRKYRVLQNGVYAVITIGNNGCESDTSNKIDFKSVGVEEFAGNIFKIYPNPVSQFLHIETTEAIKVDVLDNTGRILKQLEFNHNSDIDFRELPQGLYFIRLEYNGLVRMERISKVD